MNRKKEKFRSDAFGYTQIHRLHTQKCDNSVRIRFSLASRFLSHTVYLHVSSFCFFDLAESVRTHIQLGI